MSKEAMDNKNKRYEAQRGNVLFLILIAVALFAALSYAVTQSTRSGSGSVNSEKSLLSGASLTQYPAALRTSLIRMVLSNVSVEELKFDSPSQIVDLAPTSFRSYVFHPQGGGGIFQKAPADVMAEEGPGDWYFNAHWEIPEIGSLDAPGANEIIAFLPDVSSAVCRSINEEFGLTSNVIDTAGCSTSGDSSVPDLDATSSEVEDLELNMTETDSYSFPFDDVKNIEGAGCQDIFAGQPTGCFYDTTNSRYVFYSVLLER
jgi:hypothetical protein